VIFLVVGLLMIVGIMGGEPVGFKNWTLNDAPFHNGVGAILAVFLVAGFSFQGTELIGVAAGESENPRRNIPRAVRQVFWRILLFYVLAIFVVGLLIPYTNPHLVNEDVQNIAVSPFTIIFDRAGLAFAA